MNNSLSKEQIKRIVALHKKKFRDENQLFIIEGSKIIKEALSHNPGCIQTIYSTSAEKYDTSGIETYQINPKEISKISSLKHPQGDLAICRYLNNKLKTQPKFQLALDQIQDPGNLGTIIRLAAWFGVQEIVASPNTVDCYNPKVIQATMGAIFNVTITYCELTSFLKASKKPIYGALLDGKNMYKSELQNEGVLLMGNEGNGISDELIPFISHPISIPKFGTGESLNVAMATGILLSEFNRS